MEEPAATHDEIVAWCRANPDACRPKPLDPGTKNAEHIFGMRAVARRFPGAAPNKLRAAYAEVYGAA